jgi:hypothetical protein
MWSSWGREISVAEFTPYIRRRSVRARENEEETKNTAFVKDPDTLKIFRDCGVMLVDHDGISKNKMISSS